MILARIGWRSCRRHPLQILLAVLGVALGVAVVIGIDLANSSASKAFRLSAETLSGKATHQIVGGPEGLEETVYRRLRLELGFRASAPVVEGYATLPALDGRTVQLLGVDPLAEQPFRSYSPSPGGGVDFGRLLSQPQTALLLAATAGRLGLARGDTFQLETGGRQLTLTLAGLLAPRDQLAAQALASLVIVDIASAQEILGQLGRLSRIDLILADGPAAEAQLAAIAAILPPTASIVPASARGEVMAQMTRAFQLNLTALSLLALVVGMFLIYNTLTFAVLQRRPLLGTLRTLGVSRRQIFILVLGEALAIGLAGTLLGLLLGYGLGQGLLALVSRTINDLYFVLSVQQLTVSPWSLAKGVLLGLGATLAAAALPAWEAARTAPSRVLARSSLESRQRRLVPLVALCGVLLMAVGGAALAIPSKSLALSFGALFALITGYALVVPGMTVLLLRLLQGPLGALSGVLGRMAARDLRASLSRTGVASAALVVAVSATVGVGIMIGSFRLTVEQWLQSYLRADLYVTTPSAGFEPVRPPLAPELVERITTTPGVATATRARHLMVEGDAGPFELFVAEIPRESFSGYWFAEGNPEAIWQAFQGEAAVIVSEPFAYHRDLRPGDSLQLRTDRGPVDFRIAGVFTDYSSDRGRVTLSRSIYERYWDDRQVDALGLYLAPGADLEVVAEEVRRGGSGSRQLMVYSNRSLRETSLATFDRTFAITAVLRLLAVVVAFVGILNALMAMQIERSRELAVLRAQGLTPRQLWLLVTGETGLIGLSAGLLALPLGIIQALVLILVINRRSFGWTMQTVLSAEVLLQALLLALAAALLAGLYPAWRMARTSPALALREE